MIKVTDDRLGLTRIQTKNVDVFRHQCPTKTVKIGVFGLCLAGYERNVSAHVNLKRLKTYDLPGERTCELSAGRMASALP